MNVRVIPTVLVALLVFWPALGAATPQPPDGGTFTLNDNSPPTPDENTTLASHTHPPELGTAYGVRTMYNSTRLPRTTGGADVSIAVLDTGVDRDHPDLADRVSECRDYTGAGVTHGTCDDINGHGTHVAGVILADGGPNGTGIYGLAPEANLIAFKICTDRGSCESGDLRDAIKDAVDAGADIIVISLGGRSSPHVQGAVQYAAENDVLIIAAAGNSGPGLESIEYPAADPRVIGVGAIERTRADLGIEPDAYGVPDYSSRGANASTFDHRDGYLEVAAPGSNVRSTWPDGEYATRSGTSMAAPHIAGIAAKFWPQVADSPTNGKANAVRRLLQDRAQDFDITTGIAAKPGYDPAAGLGVPILKPPRARFEINPTIPTAGRPTTLNASASVSIDSPIEQYEWDLDGDGTPDARGQTISHTFETPGTHQVTLQIDTQDGMRASASQFVRINALPTAVFTTPASVPEQHQPVTFNGSQSVDPDGEIVDYAWDTNNDGLPDARGPQLTFAFPTYGVHTITLNVTDDVGASATTSRSILVNDPPSVTITGPTSVDPGQSVSLQATVENEIGATSVMWEFEDGTTATGPTITRQLSPGTHRVMVTVRDEHGATATTETNVTVAEPRTTTAPSQPGFTLALTVIVLLLVVGLRRRLR